MTGVIVLVTVVGIIVVGGLVAYRQSRGPTPRRREYVRMLRQYREAKLALLDVSRRTRAWRPSLDEVGQAYANEVTEIVQRFDERAVQIDLDQEVDRPKEQDRDPS